MFKKITCLLFLFILKISSAQLVSVNPPLHSPLGIPLQLSAVFGDLRPNHFHAGLDFRTNGKEGIPIFSILNGHISRIKISSTGYGKAIYINHPNGQTSVYAHCSVFADPIESVVKNYQIKNQVNELDLEIEAGKIPVFTGQLIAYSGNTGNSTGPHLHFEIRDTKTENALNPLLHGFSVNDNLPPAVSAIKLYAVDELGYLIPGKNLTFNWNEKRKNFGNPTNLFVIDQNFLPENGFVAVSIESKDPMNSVKDNFGIYGNRLILGQDTLFETCMDAISFEHSRYVNNHKDYDAYKQSKQKFHKLFRNVSNPLRIYKSQSSGLFRPVPNDTLKLSLEVFDVNKNQVKTDFKILYLEKSAPQTLNFYSPETHFIPDSSYAFKNRNYEVFIGENTFYEPVKKQLKYNDKLEISSSSIPIQRAITVKLRTLKNFEKQNQYIAANGSAQVCEHDEEWIKTNAKTLGNFSVKLDTIKPSIQPTFLLSKDSLVNASLLQWKVADKESGIKKYDFWVNEIWTPIYLDGKIGTLQFRRRFFDVGEQSFSLRVEDYCGNIKEWQATYCLDSPPLNEMLLRIQE